MKLHFLGTLFYISILLPSFGTVKCPSFFSNNMVLQRETDAAIWGWGEPSEKITISSEYSYFAEIEMKNNNLFVLTYDLPYFFSLKKIGNNIWRILCVKNSSQKNIFRVCLKIKYCD